jgi:hypothetical protein
MKLSKSKNVRRSILNWQPPRAVRKNQRQPRLEGLEDRLLLSTFNVDTTLDTVAADLRTGRDAAGHISLRSAVMAADARGGSNTIKLHNGTYTLTIAGANEDASATGDLDIAGNITIKGSGSAGTIIDGNNMDRVIQILRGNVNISGITIQHGKAGGGGGLSNSGGRVTLSAAAVVGNQAIGVDGVTGLGGQNGSPGGNGTNGSDALGGGIFNGAGSLTITNSTISGNKTTGGAGGTGGEGGFAVGANEPGSNRANAFGGGGGSGGDGAAARGGGIYNFPPTSRRPATGAAGDLGELPWVAPGAL